MGERRTLPLTDGERVALAAGTFKRLTGFVPGGTP